MDTATKIFERQADWEAAAGRYRVAANKYRMAAEQAATDAEFHRLMALAKECEAERAAGMGQRPHLPAN